MSKKNNKIMTCISPDNNQRTNMVCELAMRCRLATIRSDARKILNIPYMTSNSQRPIMCW